MRKILLIILLIVFTILCCKQRDDFLNEVNLMSKDTLITLILKNRTFKTDTIRHKNGIYGFKTQNLMYSIDGSFIEHPLPKNNYKKNDTIKIVSTKDIILYHGYYYNLYSLYKFKPGDVVEFDYPNDYPICNVKNRKLTNIDLNFLTELNVKSERIKSDSEFFIENNRFRTSIENIEVVNQIVEFNKLKEVKLDSLKNTMNVDFYNINKKDIKNSLTSENQKLLITDINLSIPSGRDLVFKTYYAKHKPIILKKKNGSIYDSRLQIEKLVKEKNISTKNKDLLLYSYMSDLITNFSNQDIKKYFEVFKNNCSDKTLIKTLNDVYLISINLDNINKNEVYLVDINKNKYDLKKLIKSKFKNKVVYIDFWASWCAPCMAEMPASFDLHEKYKKKDVVFLYISIDADFDKWKMAMNKGKLSTSVNNFIAVNYPSASFYQDLQLKTIPRYLIYDKKGILVHRNAPSPDSKEIRKELDKFLSQQP